MVRPRREDARLRWSSDVTGQRGMHAGRRPIHDDDARAHPRTPRFEPEFVAALKHLFEERIAFNKVLGLEITEIAPGGVQARLAMRPN